MPKPLPIDGRQGIDKKSLDGLAPRLQTALPEVKMDSLQRRELMMEALKQTSQYGLELVEACGNASGCLRQGKDQEGGQILRDILNGIGLISQALDMTDELRREVNADLSLNDLPPILAPLVEALENGDFSLVGDILDYEVSPVLSRWSRELTERLPDIGQP